MDVEPYHFNSLTSRWTSAEKFGDLVLLKWFERNSRLTHTNTHMSAARLCRLRISRTKMFCSLRFFHACNCNAQLSSLSYSYTGSISILICKRFVIKIYSKATARCKCTGDSWLSLNRTFHGRRAPRQNYTI